MALVGMQAKKINLCLPPLSVLIYCFGTLGVVADGTDENIVKLVF